MQPFNGAGTNNNGDVNTQIDPEVNVSQEEQEQPQRMLSATEKLLQTALVHFFRAMTERFHEFCFHPDDAFRFLHLYPEALRTAFSCVESELKANPYFSKEDIAFVKDLLVNWLKSEFFTFCVEAVVVQHVNQQRDAGNDSIDSASVAEETMEKVRPLHDRLVASIDESQLGYRVHFDAQSIQATVFDKSIAVYMRVMFPYLRFIFAERSVDAILSAPDVETQKKDVEPYLNMEPAAGETRCAVPTIWMNRYKLFLKQQPTTGNYNTTLMRREEIPPPKEFLDFVDPLEHYTVPDAEDTTSNYPHPVPNKHSSHYEFIRQEAYNLVCQWFGGGPRMTVTMAKKANGEVVPILSDTKMTLDFSMPIGVRGSVVGPVTVPLENRDDFVTIVVSPTLTVKEAILVGIEKLEQEAVREMWKFYLNSPCGIEVIKKLQYSYSESDGLELSDRVLDAIISDGQTFQITKGLEPGETKYTPGQCGLSNMGNTCFMNSALQCISNCTEFREQFLKLEGIDAEKHPVAKALRDLLKNMWSGKKSVIRPTELKEAFGNKCRRFQGYEQQDAIEYVHALLDIIHEELNPVKQKKYRERKDEDAEIPETELATIYWKDYCENNKSLIADFFHGQMKSKLECLTCGRVSTVFDGVSCLPVAIDKHEMYSYDVDVNFLEEDAPRKVNIRVRIPVDSPLSMLYAEIREWMKDHNLDPHTLQIDKSCSRPDDSFPAPTGLTSKHDHFHAYICPSFLPVHEQRERMAKRREAIRAAKEKAAEEKRKREKAAREAAAKQTKTTDGETAGPASTPDEGMTPTASTEPAKEPEEPEGPQLNRITVLIESKDSWREPWRHLQGLRVPVFAPNNLSPNGIRKVVSDTARKFLRKKVNAAAAPQVPESDATPAAADEEGASPDATQPSSSAVKQENAEESPLAEDVNEEIEISDVIERFSYQNIQVRELDDCVWFNPTAEWANIIAVYDSEKYEPVEIQVSDDETLQTVPRNKKKKTVISLEKCLSVKTQLLSGTDQWYCPQCKEHRDAKKEERIYRLPKTCIVQFKRFQMCPSTFMIRKLETEVSFPPRLDFTPYVAADGEHHSTKYVLSGIVHHSGSLTFGHYTASGRNDATWIDFNDSHVTPEGDRFPSYSLAYLCFYTCLDNNTVIEPRDFQEEDDDESVGQSPVPGVSPTISSPHGPMQHPYQPLADISTLD